MEDENRRNGGMFESSLSTGLAASSLLVSVPGFSLLNFIVKNIGEEKNETIVGNALNWMNNNYEGLVNTEYVACASAAAFSYFAGKYIGRVMDGLNIHTHGVRTSRVRERDSAILKSLKS